MKPRSIRVRLAAWYTAVLALSLCAFGLFSWLAIRQALFHTVKQTLADRVQGVHRFMSDQIGALSVEEIRDEFKEHSVLGPGGDLFQVCDAQGVWLYRSAALEHAGLEIPKPLDLPSPGLLEDRTADGIQLRVMAQRVEVLGKHYSVQVAVPIHEVQQGLGRYSLVLVLLIPLVLAVAAAGCWWLSGRALAPVDQITLAARTIGERSLSHRLPVPPTEDELQRLSLTLNQMLERIEGAFRRITEFTADASHELRTPVALMRTTAELALRKPREMEDYRSALQEIQAESVRTTELIENLLTLARADAGKNRFDAEELDLRSIVRDVATQGAKLAGAKGLNFEIVSPASPVPVTGNAGALRRLLLILVDNAVKYTHEGTVGLTLSLDRDGAAVDVFDTGQGITETDLPRIFERFYRAEKSRNRDAGGAGLGLSIAKWIADMHGASIHARSKPGLGTTFSLRFPRGGTQ